MLRPRSASRLTAAPAVRTRAVIATSLPAVRNPCFMKSYLA